MSMMCTLKMCPVKLLLLVLMREWEIVPFCQYENVKFENQTPPMITWSTFIFTQELMVDPI